MLTPPEVPFPDPANSPDPPDSEPPPKGPDCPDCAGLESERDEAMEDADEMRELAFDRQHVLRLFLTLDLSLDRAATSDEWRVAVAAAARAIGAICTSGCRDGVLPESSTHLKRRCHVCDGRGWIMGLDWRVTLDQPRVGT